MRRFACLIFAALLLRVEIQAAEPVGMASEGRLDLLADRSVESISEGSITLGRGHIDRMNWLPANQQSLGYSVLLPATHRSWREFEFQFTPTQSGQVTMSLIGPWASADGNQLIRQEVEWDALSGTGTMLPSSSGFEDPAGWQLQGGSIVSGNAQRPAAEGQRYARSWHNGRVVASLAVTAGTPVRIRGRLRCAVPEGFVEMSRILSR